MAALESFGEFRTHVDDQILGLLDFLLPLLHRSGDLGCYGLCVYRVEDIAHPLLVEVVPVLLVRKVLKQGRLQTGMLQEVLDGQTLDLWNCRYLHSGPLDVLYGSRL